jgi:hypothetical protein
MKKFTTYSIYASNSDCEEIYKFQTNEFDKELLGQKLLETVKLLKDGYTAEYGREDEINCYAPMTIIEHRKGRPMRYVKTLQNGKDIWESWTNPFKV